MHGDYVLGHAEHELTRLEHQGRYLAPQTRDVLVRAGLEPGMRVLDFGAGAGDVSVIAAEIVGPTGEVIALDRAAEAVARMVFRLQTRPCPQIQPVQGDLATARALAAERPFDAVIGRLVLLHQPDPEATLRELAALLRPGGVLALHEIDIDAGCWSQPRLPLLEQCFGWICGVFVAGGMATDIGRRMSRALRDAGLEERQVVQAGIVDSGGASDAYVFMAGTVRTLLPGIIRMKLATEAEVDVDTLAERLRAEAVVAGAHFIPCFLAGATGRRKADD